MTDSDSAQISTKPSICILQEKPASLTSNFLFRKLQPDLGLRYLLLLTSPGSKNFLFWGENSTTPISTKPNTIGLDKNPGSLSSSDFLFKKLQPDLGLCYLLLLTGPGSQKYSIFGVKIDQLRFCSNFNQTKYHWTQ